MAKPMITVHKRKEAEKSDVAYWWRSERKLMEKFTMLPNHELRTQP